MKRHAALLTVFLMLSKLLGIVREGFLAYFYGATSYADIFITASSITNILFGFIATGLTSTFIPIYSKVMHERGSERANEYLNNILNIVFILSIILLSLGLIFTEQLVYIFAKGFSGEVFSEAVRFVRVSLFGVLAIGIYNILSGYHQYHNRFLVNPIAGYILNFIIIGSIIISSRTDPIAMAYGLVLASLGQALFVLLVAYRQKDFKFKIRINFKDQYLKRMLVMAAPIIFGSSISQINTILDRTIASSISEGSISILNYADKISGSVYTLFGTTITTVSYPTLTRHGAKGDYGALKKSVHRLMTAVVMILIPASVGIIVLAEPAVELLYGRGSFANTPNALGLTARTLSFYAIGIIGYGLRDILIRTFYSIGDSKTPLFSGLVAVVVNIGLNMLFSRLFGVAVLALATSVSALTAVIVLYYSLYKKVEGMDLTLFINKTLKIILSSGFMGMTVYFIHNYLSTTGLHYLINLCISTIVGFLLYIVSMSFLKIPEFDEIIYSVKKTIRFKANH